MGQDYIDSQIEVDWSISAADLKYYCLLVGSCSFALGVIIGVSLILTYMVR
jgi:hypothetical protein